MPASGFLADIGNPPGGSFLRSIGNPYAAPLGQRPAYSQQATGISSPGMGAAISVPAGAAAMPPAATSGSSQLPQMLTALTSWLSGLNTGQPASSGLTPTSTGAASPVTLTPGSSGQYFLTK